MVCTSVAALQDYKNTDNHVRLRNVTAVRTQTAVFLVALTLALVILDMKEMGETAETFMSVALVHIIAVFMHSATTL